jgi:hypothetical protein
MIGCDDNAPHLAQFITPDIHYFHADTPMGEVLVLAEIAERLRQAGPRTARYRLGFFGQKRVMN